MMVEARGKTFQQKTATDCLAAVVSFLLLQHEGWRAVDAGGEFLV